MLKSRIARRILAEDSLSTHGAVHDMRGKGKAAPPKWSPPGPALG